MICCLPFPRSTLPHVWFPAGRQCLKHQDGHHQTGRFRRGHKAQRDRQFQTPGGGHAILDGTRNGGDTRFEGRENEEMWLETMEGYRERLGETLVYVFYIPMESHWKSLQVPGFLSFQISPLLGMKALYKCKNKMGKSYHIMRFGLIRSGWSGYARARFSLFVWLAHMSLCRSAHILYVSRSCQPQLNKLWLIYMAGLAENQTTICCFHDPPLWIQNSLNSSITWVLCPALLCQHSFPEKNEHQDISRHKDPKKNVDEIPNLVGGLEHFLFSPIVGVMIQSDELIFFQGVKTTKQHLFCISNPLAHRVLSVQDRSTHCGQRHLECGFYSGSSAKDWSGWLNPKEPQISGSSMHFTGLC